MSRSPVANLEDFCDDSGLPPTVIILDAQVRYLRLMKVLQAAGFDCCFVDPLGGILRISERVTQ